MLIKHLKSSNIKGREDSIPHHKDREKCVGQCNYCKLSKKSITLANVNLKFLNIKNHSLL